MRGIVDAQCIGIERGFRGGDGFDCVWGDVGSARQRQAAQRFSIHTGVLLRGSGAGKRAEQKGNECEAFQWFTAVSAGMSKRRLHDLIDVVCMVGKYVLRAQ
jgi:hypothetical protein